jgi:YidC/Oxa1 family membrane protein insertase
MAAGPSKSVRMVVSGFMLLMAVVLGVMLLWPSKKPQPQPTAGTPPVPATTPAAAAIAGQPASPEATKPATTTSDAAKADGPRFAAAATDPLPDPLPIGSDDENAKETDPQLKVLFTQRGAGVSEIRLAKHRDGIKPGSPPVVVQQTQSHTMKLMMPGATQATETTFRLIPFSLIGAFVDGQYVDLSGPVWRQLAAGDFEATILDTSASRPIVTIRRTFLIEPGRFDFEIKHVITLAADAGKSLPVQLVQLGPVDLPMGVVRYGGDPRRARIGLVPDLVSNPDGQRVYGRDPVITHPDLVGKVGPDGRFPDKVIWPSTEFATAGRTPAWVGMTNRFFSVAIHALPEKQPQRSDTIPPGLDKQLPVVSIESVVLHRGPDSSGNLATNAAAALRLMSDIKTIEPGKSVEAFAGVYAGPTTRREMEKDATLAGLSVRDLEIYYFPGPCSFCTFQPVAYLLRSLMIVLHDYVVFDYALAIILLVVIVRSLLHPVTRWSQISLLRFGKQMQKLAPKQKELQAKYGNDPAKMREEMARLMREEQINFSGALGCIPTLLQTPIWIALSSLMFFLFELRHEAAFFGIIQKVTGGAWGFLGDLAEPDHFLTLPANLHFSLPILGLIDSVNLLPVLLGVVFFIQQKYLSPPSTGTLSPEMELQQKIMKVMVVFLFPLMMYNAPSGLALYFITNSTLGIIESKHIRKKFEEQEKVREELAKLNPKLARGAELVDGKPKPTGWFGRLMARMEEAQKRAQEIQKMQQRAKEGKLTDRLREKPSDRFRGPPR